ncbi:MAG TPA: hypothetical protein PKD61_23575, partial [Polyangiaceae bacterium]|nr:hypothetical protein [Polyangiaceae bacterium]
MAAGRLASGAQALACAALVGCSGCDGSAGDAQPGRDASPDGAADVGGSGGSGAAGSGGTGALGGSGGTLADGGGWQPNPADWKTPTWNPPQCNYLQAVDASKALPPMPWIDCDNGIGGCVYLDTSAVPGKTTVVGAKLGNLMEVTRRSNQTRFSTPLALGTNDIVAAVYDLDGPLAAWRAPNMLTGCFIGDARFGETQGASVRVHYKVSSNELRSRVVFDESDEMISAEPKYVDINESVTGSLLATVNQVQFSKDLMAFRLIAPTVLYTWTFAGKPQLLPRPLDVSEDHSPIVYGKELLFTREFKGLAVRHPSGAVEMLHTKPNVWSALFRTDYVDIAWQELGQNGVLELWTSPFATSPAAFQARKVRVVEGIADNLVSSAFGEGWWVYRKSVDTLR